MVSGGTCDINKQHNVCNKKVQMTYVDGIVEMYRIDHSYEEYMTPYIAKVEDIRAHIL